MADTNLGYNDPLESELRRKETAFPKNRFESLSSKLQAVQSTAAPAPAVAPAAAPAAAPAPAAPAAAPAAAAPAAAAPAAAPTVKGMIAPGTLDPTKPIAKVETPEGLATIRTIGINDGESEVVIPTVHKDGRIMPDQEAEEYFYKTGEHFGRFSSVEDANAYSIALHDQHQRDYATSTEGQSIDQIREVEKIADAQNKYAAAPEQPSMFGGVETMAGGAILATRPDSPFKNNPGYIPATALEPGFLGKQFNLKQTTDLIYGKQYTEYDQELVLDEAIKARESGDPVYYNKLLQAAAEYAVFTGAAERYAESNNGKELTREKFLTLPEAEAIETYKQALDKDIASGKVAPMRSAYKLTHTAWDSFFDSHMAMYEPNALQTAAATGVGTRFAAMLAAGAMAPFAPGAAASIAAGATTMAVGSAVWSVTLDPGWDWLTTRYPEFKNWLTVGQLGFDMMLGAATDPLIERGLTWANRAIKLSPSLAKFKPTAMLQQVNNSLDMATLMQGDLSDPAYLDARYNALTRLLGADLDSESALKVAMMGQGFASNSTRYIKMQTEVPYQAPDTVFDAVTGKVDFGKVFNRTKEISANIISLAKSTKTDASEILAVMELPSNTLVDPKHAMTMQATRKELRAALRGADDVKYINAKTVAAEDTEVRLREVRAKAMEMGFYKESADPDGVAKRAIANLDPDGLIVEYPEILDRLIHNPSTPISNSEYKEWAKVIGDRSVDRMYTELEDKMLVGFMAAKGLKTGTGTAGILVEREVKSMIQQAQLYASGTNKSLHYIDDPALRKMVDEWDIAAKGAIGEYPHHFTQLARERVFGRAAKLASDIETLGLTKSGFLDTSGGGRNNFDTAQNELLKVSAYITKMYEAPKIAAVGMVKPAMATAFNPAQMQTLPGIYNNAERLMSRAISNPFIPKSENPLWDFGVLFRMFDDNKTLNITSYDRMAAINKELAEAPYTDRAKIKFDKYKQVVEGGLKEPVSAGTRLREHQISESAYKHIRENADDPSIPQNIKEAFVAFRRTENAEAGSIEALRDKVSDPTAYDAAVAVLRKKQGALDSGDILDVIADKRKQAIASGDTEKAEKLKSLEISVLQAEDSRMAQLESRGETPMDSDDFDYTGEGAADTANKASASTSSIEDFLTPQMKDELRAFQEEIGGNDITPEDLRDFIGQQKASLAKGSEGYKRAEKLEADVNKALRGKIEASQADQGDREANRKKVVDWYKNSVLNERSMTQVDRDHAKMVREMRTKNSLAGITATIDNMEIGQGSKDLLHEKVRRHWEFLESQKNLSSKDKIRSVKGMLANVDVSAPELNWANTAEKLKLKDLEIDGKKISVDPKMLLDDLGSSDEKVRNEAVGIVNSAMAKLSENTRAEIQPEIDAILKPAEIDELGVATGTPGQVGAVSSSKMHSFNPFSPETRTIDDVKEAMALYTEAINNPSKDGDILLRALDGGDTSFASAEIINAAQTLRSFRDQVTDKLRRHTGKKDATFDALLQDPKVNGILKANTWLKTDRLALLGTPQAKMVENLQIALMDQLNGTNVLKDAIMATDGLRTKALQDAAFAQQFNLQAIKDKAGLDIDDATQMAKATYTDILSSSGIEDDAIHALVDDISISFNSSLDMQVHIPDELRKALGQVDSRYFLPQSQQLEFASYMEQEREMRAMETRRNFFKTAGISMENITGAETATNAFLVKPVVPTDLKDLANDVKGNLVTFNKYQLGFKLDQLGIDKARVDKQTASNLIQLHEELKNDTIKHAGEAYKRIRIGIEASPLEKGTWNTATGNMIDLLAMRRQIMMMTAYEETLKTGEILPDTLKRIKELDVEITNPTGMDNTLMRALDNMAPGYLDITAPDFTRDVALQTSENKLLNKSAVQKVQSFLDKDTGYIELIVNAKDPKLQQRNIQAYAQHIKTEMAETARVRTLKWQEEQAIKRAQATATATELAPAHAPVTITKPSPEESQRMILDADAKRAMKAKAAQNPDLQLKPTNPEFKLTR